MPMTTKPRMLQEHLQSQSWRHLLAILATHGFSMTSSKAKLSLIRQIHAHLTKIEVLRSSITHLVQSGLSKTVNQ